MIVKNKDLTPLSSDPAFLTPLSPASGHHPAGPGRIGDCAMGSIPDATYCLIPSQRVDLNSIIGKKQRALMPANGCLVALGRRPTTDKK